MDALGSSIARTALSYGCSFTYPPRQATVKLKKARAISSAGFVEVEVTATAEHLTDSQKPIMLTMPRSPLHSRENSAAPKYKHIVAIAIGSNIGDRYASIENALREIEGKHELITITGTSFLYESEPMYVEDQTKFLNCAIMVGVCSAYLVI